MDVSSITFRPAGEQDESLLYALYASTRTLEMALVPWSAAQKADFLRLQFTAQSQYYASQFPQAEQKVIELQGQPVGRIYLDRRADTLHILDLTLLPEQRGQGLGGQIIQGLLAEAALDGKAVSIFVESYSPAQRLFARLGFQPVREEGLNLLLRAAPAVI